MSRSWIRIARFNPATKDESGASYIEGGCDGSAMLRRAAGSGLYLQPGLIAVGSSGLALELSIVFCYPEDAVP